MDNQYQTADRLTTRISIHERYSINKQGFGNWIFTQYRFRPGDRVLELGCGTASMWTDKKLPEGCALYLTDISEGMLEAVKRRNDPETAFFLRRQKGLPGRSGGD